MKELKITKGVWEISDRTKTTVETALNRSVATTGGHYSNMNTEHIDAENEANAQLIAEAGTVANECGLSPRELLSQRNELREALEKMLSRFEHSEKGMIKADYVKDLARKVLEKTK